MNWSHSDARLWTLEQLAAHKEAHPDSPYRYIDFATGSSTTQPDGELLRAAFEWLASKPFVKSPKKAYIVRRGNESDPSDAPKGAWARISEEGIRVLEEHHTSQTKFP